MTVGFGIGMDPLVDKTGACFINCGEKAFDRIGRNHFICIGVHEEEFAIGLGKVFEPIFEVEAILFDAGGDSWVARLDFRHGEIGEETAEPALIFGHVGEGVEKVLSSKVDPIFVVFRLEITCDDPPLAVT